SSSRQTTLDSVPQAAHPTRVCGRVMCRLGHGGHFHAYVAAPGKGRIFQSPPSDAGLSPPLASRQEGADLHFQIIAHFAEGTTGVADPEVVDPSGHDCVD